MKVYGAAVSVSIMYVKYKFRKLKGYAKPRGPNFSRANLIVTEIDGTRLSFRVPTHRPEYGGDIIIPAKNYRLEDMLFHSAYSKEFSVSDNWNEFELFYSSWAFYGPWFTGTIAELEMYVQLVKPVKYANEGFSLFHPRAFENIVGDYLTNEFSKYKSKTDRGKHYYIAPVNWQPLTRFPAVAVRLEVAPDLSVVTKTKRYFVFFAVDDKFMAVIQFIPSQLLNMPQDELDKRVDRSTMLELMENIIDSIDLRLSPEAQERQRIALTGLDDTSLIETHLPLKWSRTPNEVALNMLENQSH